MPDAGYWFQVQAGRAQICRRDDGKIRQKYVSNVVHFCCVWSSVFMLKVKWREEWLKGVKWVTKSLGHKWLLIKCEWNCLPCFTIFPKFIWDYVATHYSLRQMIKMIKVSVGVHKISLLISCISASQHVLSGRLHLWESRKTVCWISHWSSPVRVLFKVQA